MHKLDTSVFVLELYPEIFESDIGYCANTTLYISVKSGDFSCKTTMDIDIKHFAIFTKELFDLYESLSGEAKLKEEYYGIGYFQFTATNCGYIKVSGKLRDQCISSNQELIFENEFDQTYLRDFAKELFEKYKNYS